MANVPTCIRWMMRHLAFPSMVGNTRQPRRRTISSCRRASGLDSRSLRALCCDHKEDPCLDCLRSTAGSKPNFSESCSFAVCGSPFPPLLAPAGVAVLSTPLATTVQRARTWGCWVGEALPWRVQRLVCVAKLVAVSQSTLQFATSTLECLTRPMRVGWKSWLTAFLCFTGPSLGWTPLSCLCCAGTGHLTLGVQTKMEQLWQLLAAARKRAILNWLVNTGAPGWLSSPAKLVGVGQRSVANFSACWPRLRCAASQKSCGPEPNKRGSSGGVPFLLAPPHVRLPCLSPRAAWWHGSRWSDTIDR